MLASCKGIFENGKIILTEKPPVRTRTEVIVTFLEVQADKIEIRKLGGLKGKFPMPDNFNDPLDDMKDYM